MEARRRPLPARGVEYEKSPLPSEDPRRHLPEGYAPMNGPWIPRRLTACIGGIDPHVESEVISVQGGEAGPAHLALIESYPNGVQGLACARWSANGTDWRSYPICLPGGSQACLVIPGAEPGDRFLKLRFTRNAPSPKAVVVLRTRPGNR